MLNAYRIFCNRRFRSTAANSSDYHRQLRKDTPTLCSWLHRGNYRNGGSGQLQAVRRRRMHVLSTRTVQAPNCSAAARSPRHTGMRVKLRHQSMGRVSGALAIILVVNAQRLSSLDLLPLCETFILLVECELSRVSLHCPKVTMWTWIRIDDEFQRKSLRCDTVSR